MLGIPKYKPNFIDDAYAFKETHKNQLEPLIGTSITKFWVMWDELEDVCYPDGPVILEIGGDQYEFCAYQLDDFSLTINTIDLDEKLDWYGSGDELPLIWKENGKPELLDSLNRQIIDINILTYNFKSTYVETGAPHETGYMMHGIEFILKKVNNEVAYFSIFNALDQNGLTSEKVEEKDQIARINIASC